MMGFDSREDRARTIFKMCKEEGLTQEAAGARLGLSRQTVFNELKWFENGPGKTECNAWNEAKNEEFIKHEVERIARRNARLGKKNERTKEMMQMVIDGHTLTEVSDKFCLSPITISKLIKAYEEVDKDFYEEYREAAKSHHFGHWRKEEQ